MLCNARQPGSPQRRLVGGNRLQGGFMCALKRACRWDPQMTPIRADLDPEKSRGRSQPRESQPRRTRRHESTKKGYCCRGMNTRAHRDRATPGKRWRRISRRPRHSRRSEGDAAQPRRRDEGTHGDELACDLWRAHLHACPLLAGRRFAAAALGPRRTNPCNRRNLRYLGRRRSRTPFYCSVRMKARQGPTASVYWRASVRVIWATCE